MTEIRVLWIREKRHIMDDRKITDIQKFDCNRV